MKTCSTSGIHRPIYHKGKKKKENLWKENCKVLKSYFEVSAYIF